MMLAKYRLADIATVFNGKTPSKAEQRETGFPVLKIKDVSETGEFRGTFSSFIDETLANKHSVRWIKTGDTLILNAAHNADYVASKLFLASENVEGTLPTGEWLLVRPTPQHVIPEYLHYWLRSSETRKAVRFLVKGIHLYPKDIAELTLRLPPLDEQRRIVDILSRAEGIVRLRREAEKKTAEIIPALFIDMFGDPMPNSKKWRMTKVVDLLEIPIRNGTSPSRSGRYLGRVLTLSAITRGAFDASAVKESTFANQLSPNDEVCQNDFLVCRGNGNKDLVGRGCFPSANMPGVAFPDTAIALRISPSHCTSEFFSALWNTPYIRQQITSIAKTTNGTYKINQAGLGGIELPVPPILEQLLFSERTTTINSIQSQQSAATAKAEATFQALLGRAFSSV